MTASSPQQAQAAASETVSTSANRLRVLHVTATTTGGVGLLILSLCKQLDPQQFDMSVAFGRGYLLDQNFETSGVTVHALSTSRRVGLWSTLKATLQLYRILSRGNYDIVQSHTSVGGVIGRIAGWAARTPVVLWTVHGLGSHPGHGAWKRALIRIVERQLDRLTDHYVAVSNDLMNEGVRAGIFRSSKVTVIPNGLKSDHVPRFFDVPAQRRVLGIPEGCPVIGTVTRLEPQKANDDLLRAVALVTRHAPNLVTVIAGDGPQRAALEDLTAKLGLTGRVRFLGWRSDAVEVLGALDVFCMSSRWEGCPMVLLETMAMRRPVVATDIGGVREIVVDEKTGLLVPPGDPKAMAAAILRLLRASREREEMGAAGRDRIEREFSAQRMLSSYASLYKKLTTARRA